MPQPDPSGSESGSTDAGPLKNGISGLLLDAVGTLIRPVPSVAETYAAAARRQGVVLATEEVRTRFAAHFQSDEIHADRGWLSTDENTERERWRRIVTQVLPEVSDSERAFWELWDHFGRAASWRSYPDVAPALSRLAARGISICIGSNFDRRLRQVVAGLPELAACAGSLVISSEVGFRKPHSSFFLAACVQLHLPPDKVLCVGDDVENDVRGAINAGLSGILLDRSALGQSDLPSVPDLTALVESISLGA
jgi:putative hydrolase of the HAD superfamily